MLLFYHDSPIFAIYIQFFIYFAGFDPFPAIWDFQQDADQKYCAKCQLFCVITVLLYRYIIIFIDFP